MANMRAHLFADHQDFARRTVRLILVRQRGDGRDDVWMGGDEWRTIEEGTVTPEPPGVLLPVDAVDALREAIDHYEGKAGHAATEARVLREWLDVERARVDKALEG